LSHPIIDELVNDGINKIKIGIFDVDGVLRGKYINMKKFASALENGFGFCDVVFGWDIEDELYDKSSVTGWETGFPDAPAKIDIHSKRIIPWEPNTAFFLADFESSDGKSYPVCPRQLLKSVLNKAKNMGYSVKSAFEYEFFMFNETAQTVREKNYQDLNPLTPGMFGYSTIRNSVNSELFHDFIDMANEMDFEIEGIHTETGPGVFEVALSVDDGLSSADKAGLFKTFSKVLSQRHDLITTFMAKWSPEFPGQSGHLHLSLWDENRKSVFYDGKDEYGMSETMKYFLAGQLLLLPEVLPMIAPTINSYTRMIKGFWAPTNSNWGFENRTCAMRVISGAPKHQRIESRISAADGNPHLVLAATIACGLYGIENKLELQSPVKGNAYDLEKSLHNLELPNTLDKATEKFKNSKIMREIFGDTWVNHFTISREWESKVYKENKKTDVDWNWMLNRYFEII